jgi:hypothetical protein
VRSAVTAIVYFAILDFKHACKRPSFKFSLDSLEQLKGKNKDILRQVSDSLYISRALGNVYAMCFSSENGLGLRLIYRFDLLLIALYKSFIASVPTYTNPGESELFIFWSMIAHLQLKHKPKYFDLLRLETASEKPSILDTAHPETTTTRGRN